MNTAPAAAMESERQPDSKTKEVGRDDEPGHLGKLPAEWLLADVTERPPPQVPRMAYHSAARRLLTG